MTDFKRGNVEKFKVVGIHTNGLHGNDIDILIDKTKYQIAVDKSVELKESLVGSFIELKHKKIDGKYYFEYINYPIG